MRVIMICKRKTAQAANSASNSPFLSLSATVTLEAPRNTVFPPYVENKVLQLYSCKEAPVAAC